MTINQTRPSPSVPGVGPILLFKTIINTIRFSIRISNIRLYSNNEVLDGRYVLCFNSNLKIVIPENKVQDNT